MPTLADVRRAEDVLPLYRRAFPDEDLTGLVADLLDLAETGDLLSLGAFEDAALVGHIAFTNCAAGSDMSRSVALLGPLAVDPDHQRAGVGTFLVESGLARMKERGRAAVLVLGDPAYYRRFGFARERAVTTPHPIPEEWRDAWQSVRFDGGRLLSGRLQVPEPWDNARFWS